MKKKNPDKIIIKQRAKLVGIIVARMSYVFLDRRNRMQMCKINLSFESTQVAAGEKGVNSPLYAKFDGSSVIDHLLVLDFLLVGSKFSCLSEHQLGFPVSNVLDVVRIA